MNELSETRTGNINIELAELENRIGHHFRTIALLEV
jgi:hypothetical protein